MFQWTRYIDRNGRLPTFLSLILAVPLMFPLLLIKISYAFFMMFNSLLQLMMKKIMMKFPLFRSCIAGIQKNFKRMCAASRLVADSSIWLYYEVIGPALGFDTGFDNYYDYYDYYLTALQPTTNPAQREQTNNREMNFDDIELHDFIDGVPVCLICSTSPRTEVFLPCGHFCCCKECSYQVGCCPVCREYIERQVKINGTYKQEETSCCVCGRRDGRMEVLLPCGEMVCSSGCSGDVTHCPNCLELVVGHNVLYVA